uniref:ORF10 n=1 Tax=Amycolatopsis benzoatilytica TaxID=346045 RepID=A3FG43_9PSEU|nr:unknown [Cloning vector pDXM32]ABN48418.1 ORF10 [Amycolatopsis benzoatilytica]
MGRPKGRPPRWDADVQLKVIKARMPVELAEAFQKEAQKRGMNVQDFLGRLAEELTGVPYNPQGGLPLSA